MSIRRHLLVLSVVLLPCEAAAQPRDLVPQVAQSFASHIAFSPDGRLLAAHSGRGVSLYDVGSGFLVRRLRCVDIPVTDDPRENFVRTNDTEAVASRDGRLLASAGKNGVVPLRRTSDWKTVLPLAVLPNEDGWLVWTPDGRYDGNRLGRERILAVRHGRTAQPLPRGLHVPGLLAKVLSR